MSDLISRQAAIETVRKAKSIGQAHRMLLQLPSAQRWIPVTERLPKKPGQYYVSGGDKVWICEFLIIPNFVGGWCNDVANPVVQAWMPLPAPYRPEGEKHGTPRGV